jgi:hypothetical protein
MGSTGLIIDIHSQWHDEVLRASNLLTSLGASIIILSGPPPAAYIPLGKPLNSNYTIPKRALVPDPPAESTEFQQTNNTAHRATTKPRDEQRLQQPVHSRDYYGPNAAPTSKQHAKCEGCGRKGHTPDNCTRKEHPNWNSEHTRVTLADTAAGRTIAREAKGTYLSCLPPSGVVWDPISQQWEECKALQDWRRKIERTCARSTGRPVPPSATGPYNRPAPKPSGTPQRPSAVGKPLHSGALQLGKPRRFLSSHNTGRPVN